MPCYHPKKAIKSRYSKEAQDGHLYRPLVIAPLAHSFESYYYVDTETGEMTEESEFLIPCGKCLGCRLDYSRTWANRMTLESIYMDENTKKRVNDLFLTSHYKDHSSMEFSPWFITLTYEDSHLPHGTLDLDTGISLPTLRLKDIQDFMKRLRIHLYRKHDYEGGVRMYYCGEYGDKTQRPHYHMISWNIPIYDLQYYGKTKQGDDMYISQEINDLWGKGMVWICFSSWATNAYTARYVMKKQTYSKNEFDQIYLSEGRVPPFVRMSRTSGAIGLPYYLEHRDEIYLHDNIILPAKKKGETFKIKPPRIFDTKYGEEFPEEMKKIKEVRRVAVDLMNKQLASQTDKTFEEELLDREEVMRKRISSLRRTL